VSCAAAFAGHPRSPARPRRLSLRTSNRRSTIVPSSPAPSSKPELSRYSRRLGDLVLRGPLVEGLGRHVEAVGPDDGADLRVEAGLGEEVRIGEWLRDAAPVPLGEVDVADEPVAEGDAKLVIADDLGSDDWNELGHDGHSNEVDLLPGAQHEAVDYI
jgi:hypothetical protein